jgi:hypothetical protein
MSWVGFEPTPRGHCDRPLWDKEYKLLLLVTFSNLPTACHIGLNTGLNKIMETLQILYTFILYHSSWSTASSCYRDAGGGNLFLTVVSKTDQSGSVIFRCGDCAGQGRCCSSSCSSNHDWTVPAVWMGVLASGQTASLFGNNVRILGCTWLPSLSTYSLAVIRPWRAINGPTEYHDIAAQIITEPPRVSLLEPGIANCRLSWVLSRRKLIPM